MSYPIDVYRGDADVQRNFVSFGTFVALFPQLIAGPIVRYKDVADQLGFRASSIDQFSSGVERFMVGVAKKVLIANSLGKLWDYYAAMGPGELTFLGSWLGIAAFTLQIYFDFSGYSDMAIGLGRMIGFEFKENFNYPYISTSVTEFWRRWHMSLGTWFRDYVYIPIGGNRCGRGRQLFNIFVVWALTGIWHGANWTFLLWGLYYAVFLMFEKLFFLRALEKSRVFGHIYTIIIVMFGWVIFQLDSLGAIGTYTSAMLGFGASEFATSADVYYLSSYAITFVISIVASTPLGSKLFGKLPAKARRFAAPALTVLALVICTAYLLDETYNPFIYFNF